MSLDGINVEKKSGSTEDIKLIRRIVLDNKVVHGGISKRVEKTKDSIDYLCMGNRTNNNFKGMNKNLTGHNEYENEYKIGLVVLIEKKINDLIEWSLIKVVNSHRDLLFLIGWRETVNIKITKWIRYRYSSFYHYRRVTC